MQNFGITISIGGDIGELQRALRQAEGSIQAFSKKNESLFQKLDKIALPVAAAFAGLTATVGVAVNAFSNFESTLKSIQAVSGATAAEIRQMKAAALELGATTKFSAQEAAEGMAELSKAGFTTRETLAAIPGVLSLAAAGGTSVAQAAEIAGGALRGFGLAASEAAKVSDILAQVANKSSVDVSDVGESFKYVAPLANATKQNIEGMSAAIAIMGNQMIKGSQAGTTIRAGLAALLNPSKDAQTEMAKLGLSIKDTSGRMLPLQTIVDQLRDKTKKMTDVQKSATIANIFGTEALSGMLALINTSPKDYQAMVDSMNKANGAAKDMADTMNSGLKPSFDAMLGSLETLGIQIGENFAPILTSVINGISAFVNAIVALPDGVKLVIAGVTAAGIAFLGLVTALTAVGGIVTVAAAGIGAMGLTVSGILPTLVALSATVGVVTAAFALNAQTTGETTKEMQTNADQVDKLVAEYDELKTKTNLTTQEKERLLAILEELNKISPALISDYNNQGQAADINRAAVDRLNQSLATQISLEQQAAQAARERARATVAANRITMQDAVKDLKANQRMREAMMKSINDAPAGAEREAMRRQLQPQVDQLDAFIRIAGERISNSKKMLDESEAQYSKDYLNKAADNVQLGPEAPRKIGAAVTMPKTGGGKKSGNAAANAAKRAIEEAYRNMIKSIENRLELALKQNEIDKGGIAGEREIKNNFTAELQKKVRKDDLEGMQKIKSLKLDIYKLDKEMAEFGEQALEAGRTLWALLQKTADAKKLADEKKRDDNLPDEISIINARNEAEQNARLERLTGLKRERAEIRKRFEDEIKAINEARAAELKRIQAKNINAADKEIEKENADRGFDAQISAAMARNSQAVRSFNNVWRASLEDMVGSIAKFAQNPDLGSIASFTYDLITNQEQVNEWSQSIDYAAGMIKDFASAENKATTELGLMWSAFNPLTLAIVGAGVALGSVMNAFKDIRKPMDDLIEINRQYSESMAALNLQIRAGLVTTLEEALNGQLRIASDRLDALIEKQAKYKAGQVDAEGKGADWMTRPKGGADPAVVGVMQKEIDEAAEDVKKQKEIIDRATADAVLNIFGNRKNTIDRKKDLGFYDTKDSFGRIFTDDDQITKDQFAAAEETMQSLMDLRAQALADGKADLVEYTDAKIEAFKPHYDSLKGETDAIEKHTQQVEDAKKAEEDRSNHLDEYAEKLTRLVEIDKELNEGGRNKRGEKISLEDEKIANLAELRKEHEKAVAENLERQEEVKKRIAKIDEDLAKKIKEISDEGIAERAETETQSKSRRIDEATKDAEEKKADANKELKNLEKQASEELTNYNNQKAYIKNIADERIKALNLEKAALDVVLAVKESDLKLERKITAEKVKQAALAGRTISGKDLKGLVNNVSGITAPDLPSGVTYNKNGFADLTGLINPNTGKKYHSGGTVPGSRSDEVWALLQGQEKVLTPEQWRNEIENRSGRSIVQQSRQVTNNQNVTVSIEQHITTQPGQDEREVANEVNSDLSTRLRRAGLPIIG